MNLLISASGVARITGVSHQHLAMDSSWIHLSSSMFLGLPASSLGGHLFQVNYTMVILSERMKVS
jgi:hypothetical protein